MKLSEFCNFRALLAHADCVSLASTVFYCSVAKSCLMLCHPMYCSPPGFPVLHYFPEFAQTHVHCIDDPGNNPAILSYVITFSSYPQSFPSGSFPMSWLFASSYKSVGASASVFSMNIQSWFPLGCLVWCPCWRRDSQESYPMRQIKSINFPLPSLLYFQLSHLYMTTGTTIALTIGNFVGNVMSLFLICCLGLL